MKRGVINTQEVSTSNSNSDTTNGRATLPAAIFRSTRPHPMRSSTLIRTVPDTGNPFFINSSRRSRFLLLRDLCYPQFPSDLRLSIANIRPKTNIQMAFHGGFSVSDDASDIIPILTSSQVLDGLKIHHEENNKVNKQAYSAMYSSVFGGITTEPAYMVISMDDHMVHRGHGVFDTAAVVNGHLYELDQHIDRFLKSASMARIKPPFNRAKLRSILIQTVSASGCKNGSLRYWMSSGPGNFRLSPSKYSKSALYAIVTEPPSPIGKEGVKVVTSSIPMKPPLFATMKSVNYLPNVLSKMEAEDNGGFAAIWVDDEGYIAEGPNMNVAFILKNGTLVMPKFDGILSGCTAKRVLILADQLVKSGQLNGIQVRHVSVEEGKSAREMMLIGSGIIVKPVVQWDDTVIGDGKEGEIAQSLLDLILEDMKSGPPVVRTPVC